MKAVESHLRRPREGRNHRHLQDGDRSFCHTVGCSHRLSLLPYFFNYRIFNYKEKNTWWAWQVAHSAGIGWYSVCELVRWMTGFPLHSDELGKISVSVQHLPIWLMASKEASSCLWPMEKCLSVLSAFRCTTEEYPLTITFQRLD